MAEAWILALQMVNISIILTSLSLCGAIYYFLGTMNPDLFRVRLFMMAENIRRAILLFLVGFGFLIVWESLLAPGTGVTGVAYSMDLLGEACLLWGIWQLYGLVKPQVNMLGASDEDIAESQRLAAGARR